MTKEIHGVGTNYIPDLGTAINFYKEGPSRQKIGEALREAIECGNSWDLELQIITKQDEEKWVRAIGRSNYKDGICTKVYGTFQDIDERKKAEIESVRSGKLSKDVLQAASEVSIIATDAEGVIKLFNSGAEKMLGYAAGEVIHKSNPGLFHLPAEVSQRSLELTEEYGYPIKGFEIFVKKVKEEGVDQRKWTFVRKDGTKVPVSLIITLINNAENEIEGFLGVATLLGSGIQV